MMEAEYSDDMIDVELKALFPEYGMSFFPKGHLHACTDQSLNDAMEEALRPEKGSPKKGYDVEEHPRYGITKFQLPPNPRHAYIMAGDPGTDGPPHRNAGVVGVFDVTSRPIELVYFHWTEGKGSYNPFLNSYKMAMEMYRPVLKGMDTTGPQKAIDELAFENMGLSIDGINFQRDKDAMLNSLSMDVTNHNIKWPVIKGLIKQASSYSKELELKKGDQDIVMMLAQGSFLARFVSDPETIEDQQAVNLPQNVLCTPGVQEPHQSRNHEETPAVTVYGWDGRIVHHNDCTYCKLRQVIEGKPEIEYCGVTGSEIPAPRQGERYCEHYQQKSCECARCNISIPIVRLTLRSENAKIQRSNSRGSRKAAEDNQGTPIWGNLWGGN